MNQDAFLFKVLKAYNDEISVRQKSKRCGMKTKQDAPAINFIHILILIKKKQIR